MHSLKNKQTVFPTTVLPSSDEVMTSPRIRGNRPKQRKVHSHIKKVQDLRFLVEQDVETYKKEKKMVVNCQDGCRR